MDAALELVRAGPAAGALLLVGPDRAGAGDAPDRSVPGVVQRVVRNVVRDDIAPDPVVVPVGQRLDLPDPIALRAFDLPRVRTGGRLVTTDAGDPSVVWIE